MAPRLPWCIGRSRRRQWGAHGRLTAFYPVLLSPASPGLANGSLVLWLWAVFWGAESEFEVRLFRFGRLGNKLVLPFSISFSLSQI